MTRIYTVAAVVAWNAFGQNPSVGRLSTNYPKISKTFRQTRSFSGARAPGCSHISQARLDHQDLLTVLLLLPSSVVSVVV